MKLDSVKNNQEVFISFGKVILHNKTSGIFNLIEESYGLIGPFDCKTSKVGTTLKSVKG